jgi:hypothetical protein
MKGTSKEVTHFGKCGTWSAHHLSGLGRATCKCWGPVGRMPILGRKYIVGAGLFFEKDLCWGKTYFWKGRPNFGVRATCGKKEAC